MRGARSGSVTHRDQPIAGELARIKPTPGPPRTRHRVWVKMACRRRSTSTEKRKPMCSAHRLLEWAVASVNSRDQQAMSFENRK